LKTPESNRLIAAEDMNSYRLESLPLEPIGSRDKNRPIVGAYIAFASARNIRDKQKPKMDPKNLLLVIFLVLRREML
jgi:hypothetical protein